LTLHNYTIPGSINGINIVYPAVAKNNLWIPITQGNQVSYAIKNSDDNISSRRYDISNPPSPIKTSKIYISAYNKTIYCSTRLNDVDENTDMTLYVKINRGGSETIYKSGSKFSAIDTYPKSMPFGQFVHVSGDVITATFPRAGDKVFYALEKAGRISSYEEDGDIPAAPDANKLAYYSSSSSVYASGGYVVVSPNATTDTKINAITCYQSDDPQGSLNIFPKGSLTAITDWTRSYDFLARNSNSNPPVANSSNIETGKYVLYTHTNSNGNISSYTVDGVIPQKPVLPESNVLVGAGDGGSGAEASYINKNGHAAVKMRPGVPLLSGEAISLKASSSDNKTIIMTARAT
ncbi:MAG TPA: hypothetical protein PKW98_21030, partial [Candidatus Wallbacteria bacterium]|nr:hypothetical protein [Candidatus Wallbacteria bacterium]